MLEENELKTFLGRKIVNAYYPNRVEQKGDEYTPILDLVEDIQNSNQKPENAGQMEDDSLGKIEYDKRPTETKRKK